MSQRSKRKPGRPNTLGEGAQYITVKMTAAQIRAVNRIGCPGGRPGGRPQAIRDLIDAGLAAHRKRRA